MREVEVKTPGHIPTGEKYEHPSKANLDYKNPITTIYHNAGVNRLYFGSKDGSAGVIPNTNFKFTPVSIDPPTSIVNRINVNYYSNCIAGLKFFRRDGKCVLEAGQQLAPNNWDITLQEGERLLGIRSTTYANNSDHNRTLHCNMIFVIGRLA